MVHRHAPLNAADEVACLRMGREGGRGGGALARLVGGGSRWQAQHCQWQGSHPATLWAAGGHATQTGRPTLSGKAAMQRVWYLSGDGSDLYTAPGLPRLNTWRGGGRAEQGNVGD